MSDYEKGLTILLGALVFVSGYSFHALQLELDIEADKLESIKTEPINELGIMYRENSGSSSMIPLIFPDTISKNRKIVIDEKLLCGHVYLFNLTRENETHNLIHRFIYKAKNGSLYFKGDNNRYMDAPVNREQVFEEVVGFEYPI